MRTRPSSPCYRAVTLLKDVLDCQPACPFLVSNGHLLPLISHCNLVSVYTWARCLVSTILLPRGFLLKADSDISFQWATLWNGSLGVSLLHAPLHRVQHYPATFLSLWILHVSSAASSSQTVTVANSFVLMFLHLVWKTDGPTKKISCGEGQWEWNLCQVRAT